MNDRRGLMRRLAPLLLIAGLAVALVVSPGIGRWNPGGPDADDALALRARVDDLAPGELVLVAFDPDLATYAEIRPAVRATLDALAAGRLRVAIVSLTPEGRALAAAELARFSTAPLELGFIPGGEAALVASVGGIVPGGASGPVANAIRDAGGGLSAFELAIIVGGGDIGPRSWVEQVGPRVPELPLAAIVPSLQRPQLEPYRASGQLAELVVGPDAVAASAGESAAVQRAADAVLLGMLVAIGVLLGSGVWPHLARRVDGEPDAEDAT